MESSGDGLPYLTAGLPGTGGRIKENPDDFIVEEIPLYEPSGKGTHLFLHVEKKGISTLLAIQRLADALDRKEREFGVAGLKDACATTRQFISIEHVETERALELDIPGIRILDARPHRNKLKRGHLRGNRFGIAVQDPGPDALADAGAVLAILERRGVPNYFGPQRFGILGNTHLLGKALMRRDFKNFADILIGTPRPELDPSYDKVIDHYGRGEYGAALTALRPAYEYEGSVLRFLQRTGGDFTKAALSLGQRIRTLYLSAYQSELFNRLLAWRLDRVDELMEGDVAFIHRNGASFLVEDAELEMPRVGTFEISPSGPLFGSKLLRAEGIPGRMEARILEEEKIDWSDLQVKGRFSLRGARRPLRVPLRDVRIEQEEDGGMLRMFFDLPPGSYATVVLSEIMKSAKAAPETPLT